MTNELDELFVSNSETFDKTLLKDLLQPYVQLTQEGIIDFKETFFKLSNDRKIIVYTLAKKALKLKNVIDSDNSSIKEISERIWVPYGTVGRIVKELEKINFLKNDNGTYFFPNYGLMKIKGFLLFPLNEAK